MTNDKLIPALRVPRSALPRPFPFQDIPPNSRQPNPSITKQNSEFRIQNPLNSPSQTAHQQLTNYSPTAQGERFVSRTLSPTHCHSKPYETDSIQRPPKVST